jgi:hypothetical protein
MSKAEQPPFKRGEWVIGFEDGRAYDASLGRVKGCEEWRFGWCVHTVGGGCYEASEVRLATARELRAESKRLAARAAVLSRAAEAVSAKKGAGR